MDFACMHAFVCVDVGICALTVPPMRKSSPATYCMRSCCWQHPSTPMIHPKRMMDTAMPTKPAVILLRSASRNENFTEGIVTYRHWILKLKAKVLLLLLLNSLCKHVASLRTRSLFHDTPVCNNISVDRLLDRQKPNTKRHYTWS